MKHVRILIFAIATPFSLDWVSAGETPAVAGLAPAKTDSMDMMSGHASFSLTGWIETGFTGNFASPNDRQNFGRLLDDRSNELLLNQFVVTAERMLDPKMSDHFDWGFKFQALYGSDARYLKSTGLLDLTTDALVQPDIPEVWLLAHVPIAETAGGLDLKLGKYQTCIGAEMSDPRLNPFYSHSYIFNFGAPFNVFGALATLHARPWLDIYAALTRGVNVTFDDPNNSVAFYGGFGGSFNDGRFSYMATTHIGPEDPNDNHDYRYLSAITLTWKVTDKLKSITDLNYIYEGSVSATGYGAAQYFTYAINDWLTAGIRGEVWRDKDGFFVAQFASNNDFIHFELGDDTAFDPRTVGGGRTTYGALTVGLNFTPPMPKPLTGLMIRPEIRYDRSLNGTHPFNDSSDVDMVTAGVDVILSF
jgi:hypothetical protein